MAKQSWGGCKGLPSGAEGVKEGLGVSKRVWGGRRAPKQGWGCRGCQGCQ